MIAVGSLAILRPFWLLVLPLVAAVVFLRVKRRGRLGAWQRAVDPHLLRALAHRGAVLTAASRPTWPLPVVVTLLALALAGPAAERADAGGFRNLDAVLLVVDLSSAMTQGGNLQRVRIAVRELAAAAGTRQVGMIVYAGDAYLANPLSSDEAPLASTVSVLDSETVPDRGDRPDKALALAQDVLKQAGVVAADVVLVAAGDAMDAAVLHEAHELAKAGYTVDAVAAAPPTVLPAEREGAMRKVAAAGAGGFAVSRDLTPVTRLLTSRPAVRLGGGEFALLVWRDFGLFLLFPAAAAALFMFRRSPA